MAAFKRLLLLAAVAAALASAAALNPVQRGPPDPTDAAAAVAPQPAAPAAAAPAPAAARSQPDAADARPPPPASVYAPETPVDIVAREAAKAVEAAAARAARRRAAAAAATGDATADAAADPHPEEKPTRGPPVIRDALSAGVTASPMEIISAFQGRTDGDSTPLGPLPASKPAGGKPASGGMRIEADAGGCTDIPKDGNSCAQQKAWGSCDKPWMAGYCDKTCGRCTDACACTDTSPRPDTTCRTHADWGQCDVAENPWMAPCAVTCGWCADTKNCAPPAPSSGASVCKRDCYNTLVPLADGAIPSADLSVKVPITPATPFVAAAGRRLTVGGVPFYFGGTNMYSLMITDWWNDTMIETAFRETARRGGAVVRVFAFSNGYGGKADGYDATKVSKPIQPRVGVFSEDGLARLDLIVATAAKYGVRLVMALSNWWDELGGCQWYVDSVLGRTTPPRDKEAFFYDDRVREAYADYIYHIVTRTNRITGVKYRDDPAIMAWELMNEPQTRDGYDGRVRGLPPGGTLALWVREMASFIKAIDAKHLVATGEEGWRCAGAPNIGGEAFRWINNGTKGACAETHWALPEIDLATVHVYASNWGFPATAWSWLLPNFVADRALLAARLGRPILLEEYGSPFGYVPDRDALLAAYTAAAGAFGYVGALLWQVFPWKTGNFAGAGYDFDYSRGGSASALTLYDTFAAKSRMEAALASAGAVSGATLS